MGKVNKKTSATRHWLIEARTPPVRTPVLSDSPACDTFYHPLKKVQHAYGTRGSGANLPTSPLGIKAHSRHHRHAIPPAAQSMTHIAPAANNSVPKIKAASTQAAYSYMINITSSIQSYPFDFGRLAEGRSSLSSTLAREGEVKLYVPPPPDPTLG